MKGVFDLNVGAGFRDEPARHYHFPSDYLRRANACLGDWIVYRETRRNGGRQAYVAVARVTAIEEDRERFGHYYARVSDFLPFARPVPLRTAAGRYAEASLRELSEAAGVGRTLRGNSVRPLSDEDFAEIVLAGLAETLTPLNAARLGLAPEQVDAETREFLLAPPIERQRRVVQMLVNRTLREASFRQQVCEAYEERCAITRLKIVNGGGRAEVQAAHIVPVEHNGPDIVQNGIALSGTVHWLFDRHLISLSDEYGLLVAHNRVPTELQSLFSVRNGRVHLPKDQRLWPSPHYMQRHREAFASAEE